MQLPDHIDAALRDYDRRRDRASPPVFVGRASELSFLRDAVAAAQSGAEGITALLQGVPGVGKSAFAATSRRSSVRQWPTTGRWP